MTIKQIAVAFSLGEFERIFPYLNDVIKWEIIGESYFDGKPAVMEQCQQVLQYFKSLTTKFDTIHAIVENNIVVVNGTAEFIRDGKQVSYVYACDVYAFNDEKEIIQITSYCIQKK